MMMYGKPYNCIIDKNDLFGVDKTSYLNAFQNFLMNVKIYPYGTFEELKNDWDFSIRILDKNRIVKR